MKKLVFTLAIGIFFVTFANAQEINKESVDGKETVELATASDDMAADKKAEVKKECTDKKAKTECTDKKAKTECNDKKASSKKASLRPSSCADKKKSSCKDKKSSCKDKK